MIRFKLNLKLAIVALFAFVAVDGTAQNKVTYEFTGSILNSNPIGMKASGTVPPGVTVGSIENWEKHLFGGFTTLYVTRKDDPSIVTFNNFKYEVSNVKWKRRSQLRAMTSRGETWVERADGEVLGYHDFIVDEDEEDYSTSGELLYHEKEFINPKYMDYTDPAHPVEKEAVPFAGLNSLNVKVKSHLEMQGVAVKEFDIFYYKPEPVITSTKPTQIDVDDDFTIEVYIDKAHHIGAFEPSDFKLLFEKDELLEIVGDPIISFDDVNKKFLGIYKVKAKGLVGTTKVSCAVTNGQYAAGKYYIAGEDAFNLKIGSSSREWVHEFDNNAIYNYYNNGNLTDSYNCKWESNKYNEVRSTSVTPVENLNNTYCYSVSTFSETNTATNGRKMSLVMQTNANNDYAKIGVTKVSYRQFVPAYASVSLDIKTSDNIKVSTSATNIIQGSGTTRGAEVINLGSNNTWPFSTGVSSNNGVGLNTNQKFRISNGFGAGTMQNSDNSIAHAFKSGAGDGTDTFSKTFSYNSSDVSTKNSDLGKVNSSVGGTAYQYFLLCTTKQSGGGSITGTYNITSDATYTYYAHITYNANGGNGSIDSHSITKTGAVNVAAVPGVGGKLKKNTTSITWDNHRFLGWNTMPDGSGDMYEDEAEIEPYDAVNECGVGPITLYAQWEEIPTSMVVTYIADGGSIAGASANAKYTKEVNGIKYGDAFTQAPLASKNGYNFAGYYDNPDFYSKDSEHGGIQLTDASGNLIPGNLPNAYVDASSKWIITNNQTFYAKFTPNGDLNNYKYTLELNSNGGTTPTQHVEVLTGSDQNNNLNAYTPSYDDDHQFAGWYTAATGGEMVYDALGQSVLLDSYTPGSLGNPAVYIYKPYNSTYWNTNAEWCYDNTEKTVVLYAHWIAPGSIHFYEKNEDGGHNFDYADASLVNHDTKTVNNHDVYTNEYQTLVIHRTLKKNNWNTICFPFNLTSDQAKLIFEKVMEYGELKKNADNTYSMLFNEKINEGLVGGKPYFVRLKDTPNESNTEDVYVDDANNVTTITATNVTLENTAGKISKTSTDGKTVDMIGSFVTVLHIGDDGAGNSDKKYLYLQNDKFYVSGENYDGKVVWGNNRGYRCTFYRNDANLVKASALFIDLEGYEGYTGAEADAIEQLEAQEAEGRTYDLSGRQLSQKPQRGLYIVNGKKYVVK